MKINNSKLKSTISEQVKPKLGLISPDTIQQVTSTLTTADWSAQPPLMSVTRELKNQQFKETVSMWPPGGSYCSQQHDNQEALNDYCLLTLAISWFAEPARGAQCWSQRASPQTTANLAASARGVLCVCVQFLTQSQEAVFLYHQQAWASLVFFFPSWLQLVPCWSLLKRLGIKGSGFSAGWAERAPSGQRLHNVWRLIPNLLKQQKDLLERRLWPETQTG